MLKQDLGDKFRGEIKLETVGHNDQLTQGMDFFPWGIEKLVIWCDRCLTCVRDCGKVVG